MLRPLAFAALVLATVGAFFVTQHLKISTPLIQGDPHPSPAAFNPVSGRICRVPGPTHALVDFRRGPVLLLSAAPLGPCRRSTSSANAPGQIVATVAANRYMAVNNRNPDGDFRWNGREGSGHGPYAPDGTYYFEIVLEQENRTFYRTQTPFQLITTTPHPRVTGVAVTGAPVPSSGPAVISRPGTDGHDPLHARRLPAPRSSTSTGPTAAATPVLVKRFGINGSRGVAVWDGTIGGVPAPAGTYLVGIVGHRSGLQPRPVPGGHAAPARDDAPHRRDGPLPRRRSHR